MFGQKEIRSPTYQSSMMLEGMGANGPLAQNPPLQVNMSVNHDIHKASFNYKKILQQKRYDQPPPKFIRDSMNIEDIKHNNNGEWSPKRENSNDKLPPRTLMNQGPTLMGKGPSTKRKTQLNLGNKNMSKNGQMIMNALGGHITNSLDSHDIMGAYVNHEKYKPRNYNHMDYSDVTHAHKNRLL